MAALNRFCLEQGLYLYTHWHTILIIPPLIITPAQLEEGFAVLDAGLKQVDASL
jgi:taurine--2-oxoglutarate transaminase